MHNDGSGELQVSHNARRSVVLRVSPNAGLETGLRRSMTDHAASRERGLLRTPTSNLRAFP
jgi:hypothetical protein